MASKYWAKLWIEILDDPKMGRMTDRLFRRTIELILLAKELDQEGLLPPPPDIAWRLRLKEDDLLTDLADLASVGVVHHERGNWIVTNFNKRQSKIPGAERVRLHRESQKKDIYYGKTEEPEEEPEEDFVDNFQGMLETILGIMATPRDIEAIDELLDADVTEEDVRASLAWRLEEVGKPWHSIAAAKKSILYNKAMRIQESNARAPRKVKRKNEGALDRMLERLDDGNKEGSN